MTFLPHPQRTSAPHRPSTPRGRRLVTRLAAALAIAVSAPALAVATAGAADAAEVLAPVVPAAVQEQQILAGFNAERARVGAGPVSIDPTLDGVAQRWADVLGQGPGMKHNPDLPRLLSGFPRWGEIVATADMGVPDRNGKENAQLAITSWLNSPAHKAVMLDGGYNSVGIGMVYTRTTAGGRDVWRSYWVADFGSGRRPAAFATLSDGSRSYGSTRVKGALLGGYLASGAEGGALGFPVGNEYGPLRGGGFGQAFQGGSLYWSPASGAAPVRGAIRDRWASLGWENSALGYPTGAEFGVRGGALQRFQNGSVYFSGATGAQAVRGAILAEYASFGWERGRLGFPTTSEASVPGGAVTHFQGGSVFWSPATGAHPVWGAVRDRWAAQGWESSRLGFPSSDEFGGLRGGGAGQAFRNGFVYWSPASGAHTLRGAILRGWQAQGWETGRLGYPTSEEYPVAGGVRQDFQGGSLTWAGGRLIG
ncbi:CAP domain-containing protein [Kineococcus gynurae]|uniref:CAP domain-containing protein n=1 Tax=Kineococcus gynurae TaxID=452979 RepID=A0ABV5LNZ2_9ACTN